MKTLKFRNTSTGSRLDSAFVMSSQNLEVSVVTPLLIPRVSNKPIVNISSSGAINSISQNLDSVASQSLTALVLVNTALVSQEILVDSEGSLHRTVLGNLSDQVAGSVDLVHMLGLGLVLRVSGGVVRIALLVASWSWVLLLWTRLVVLGSDVVGTWLEWVRLTPSVVSVKVAGNESGVPPVEPSWVQETSVATISASVATGQQVG